MKTLNEVIKDLKKCMTDDAIESEGFYLATDSLFYLKEYRWIVENCADFLAEKYPSENVPLTWDEESETKWIPVTERLPETDKAVLCTVQGYKDERLVFTDCRYKNDRWEFLYEPNYDYWAQLYNVLAWMPLPKPWRG